MRFPQWKFSPGLPFALPTGERGDPRCSESYFRPFPVKGGKIEDLGGIGEFRVSCLLACSALCPLPTGPQVEKVPPAPCQQSQGRELCQAGLV